MKDDPSKPANPLKAPVTVSYKRSRKNAINKEGGRINSKKNMMFQSNSYGRDPEYVVTQEQRGPKRQRKEPRLDPFMVRQAKLKAKQAE